MNPNPQEPIRIGGQSDRVAASPLQIARLRQAADEAAKAIDRLKLEIEQLARQPGIERIHFEA